MKKIVLINAPTYGNIGDLAIAIAEKKFIKDNLQQYEYMEVLEIEFKDRLEEMKKLLTSEDVIVLTGGGNMGSEYICFEETRRTVIEEFPNNKIIIMPQTIYFHDTPLGKEELEKTKKIYNNHKYLTVVAREKVSFEIMKKEFSNVNIILAPDIVMYLNETKTEKRTGVVMAMRNDKEKTLNIDRIEDIEKDLLELEYKKEKVEQIDENRIYVTINNVLDNEETNKVEKYTCMSRGQCIIGDMRDKVFQEKLDEFRSAELVITDRLHGMIFAAITSTPCIAFGNYNYKIESSFEWLKEQKFIKFLRDTNNLEEVITELKAEENYEYNNDFAIKEYNKIIDAIKG